MVNISKEDHIYDIDPRVYIFLITSADLDLSEDQYLFPVSEPPPIIPPPVIQETTVISPLHVDIVPLQHQ